MLFLFQKYLLGEVKELPYWQAADLYKDDTLDVFNLAMMKRKLIQKVGTEYERL